jgi:hypothetical protein
MSPEELALLTEEERAGLDEEHSDDLPADDDTDTDDDQDGDGKDGEQNPDDQQQPGRDDGNDDQPGDDDQGEDDSARPLPLLKVETVEDAEAKLADIDKREDEISQKFEDGDLTTAEYRAELRKLEKERGTIERQQLEADFAEKHNQAQIDAMWQANVQTFLEGHPEIGKSELRWNAFDSVVRKVTAETMQAGKNPGMADLKKAYKQWAEDLGLPAEQPKADDKSGKEPARKQERQQREIPPSLAKVPAADINDTDDGRWASLDRLMDTDPLGFEKAFGKLSEADQEAYLASR